MNGRLATLLFFLILSLCTTSSFAQNLTGIWRGYFITESGENYRLEFQINLNKSKTTTGVSYSYLDVRFYGKATMTGYYSSLTKELKIQELKTVEVRNVGGGSTCIMNYKLNYAQSGKEEFLEGTYIGKQEAMKEAKWGDCGGGKVFLRKVTTSDFYLEPFLKNKDLAKTPTTPKTNIEPKPKTAPAKPIAPQKKPVAKAPVKKQPQATKRIPAMTKVDTIQKPKIEITQPGKIAIKPITIPPQTRSRENNVIRTIEVTNPEVIIKIYDNGEIDDDTVSVYLDNKLIIANKRISDKPIVYTFKINEDEPEHIVTMVAENLGRIPPNTSLMIVYDGETRHEVYISTNEQKNAVIRFRYKKTGD